MGRKVQVGGIILITQGPALGKLAVIVDIIDTKRFLIDGPCTGVARQVLASRHFSLTALVINLPRGARTGTVRKKWDTVEIQKEWEETAQFKKLHTREQRSQTNDFDRFVIDHLKKRVPPILVKALIQRNYHVKMTLDAQSRAQKKNEKEDK